MDEILIGGKRRYHIESLVRETPVGRVYRAFSRRRVGQKIRRRYYAVVEKGAGVGGVDFDNVVLSSIMVLPVEMHLEEEFEKDGVCFAVLAMGKDAAKKNGRWEALQNHGYLMLFLSAVIFILLIVKFFQG